VLIEEVASFEKRLKLDAQHSKGEKAKTMKYEKPKSMPYSSAKRTGRVT